MKNFKVYKSSNKRYVQISKFKCHPKCNTDHALHYITKSFAITELQDATSLWTDLYKLLTSKSEPFIWQEKAVYSWQSIYLVQWFERSSLRQGLAKIRWHCKFSRFWIQRHSCWRIKCFRRVNNTRIDRTILAEDRFRIISFGDPIFDISSICRIPWMRWQGFRSIWYRLLKVSGWHPISTNKSSIVRVIARQIIEKWAVVRWDTLKYKWK